MIPPSASIVIPTRDRLAYLEVALESIAPQAAQAAAEMLVVDDAGPSLAARELAARFGARYEPHERPRGLNAARNTGLACTRGEMIVFVDDDVRVEPGWLTALLRAAREHPEVDVFTGPIRPRMEGARVRGCGREGALITALDLGPHDTPARYAWGANMAVRRGAFDRAGEFDVSLEHGGDEQEWQDRLAALAPAPAATPVLYVAAAALEHRRSGKDARLISLSRTAHARGRAARRLDARAGRAPSLSAELMTLARCVGHVVRRRCAAGLTLAAHSAGRVRQCLAERRGAGASSPGLSTPSGTSGSAQGARAAHEAAPGTPAQADFLSGSSGTVGGLDAMRRRAGDAAIDVWEILTAKRTRLRNASRAAQMRRVLAIGVVRPEHRALSERARLELERSHHELALHTREPEGRGKFETLNLLLADHPPEAYDWLVVLDDDVRLPGGFLDRFIFLCERFALQLAQPAHRLDSHAAWPHTRRRRGSVAHEVAFVEIGPVTAFARETFTTLLPFPGLRMGWGLDAHWAALARERGWRCGVIDAVAIAHRSAPAAAAYSREAAVAEARAFLAERPYVRAEEARRTLATHRHW
ncbi:MAG: glycosyltransferase family 2 protein [Actinobacteria bacterium]|nr:MAG: glycosyltransferase family 2 protein [Actinomycetota bacterium]